MPPLCKLVYSLSGRFISLLKRILSAIRKHNFFSYLFGRPIQDEENYEITSVRSPTIDTGLEEAQLGPSPSFLPTPPPTSPIDYHPKSPQSYKKKALLVGVESTNQPGSTERAMRGPHNDIRNMRQYLIDYRQYHPDEIIVLVNTDDPAQIQPTKKNIEHHCIAMVAGACKGDRFYFHFAGHTTQKPSEGDEEEDGKDEYIRTCDDEVIQDNSLRKMLVDPLPAGAKLVAVFDACNSATLLDLEHYRCNRVYVPWINKGFRRTASRWNTVVRQGAAPPSALSLNSVMLSPTTLPAEMVAEIFPLTQPPRRSATITAGSSRDGSSIWFNCPEIPIDRCDSPVSRFCTGHCNNSVPQPHCSDDKADVICLSSAKDCQRSWQDRQGSSMTQALIKFLSKIIADFDALFGYAEIAPAHKSDPTIAEVLTAVSHELHTLYLVLHQDARQYKQDFRETNGRRQEKGKPLLRRRTVEMDNFQDPQVSSHRPLVMKRRWEM
ncbi:hypothetical protein BYT27DRAFT_7333839 [Phlegmacium glaucopus]|nr:hypothetical protein BYT27DRAFT_7333839 [Phlegmacium glaucopus]